MNLFGYKLYAPEGEQTAPEQEELVLDIEGLAAKPEPEQDLTIKTDTSELPAPAELAEIATEQSPEEHDSAAELAEIATEQSLEEQDSAAEVAELMQQMLAETKEARQAEAAQEAAPSLELPDPEPQPEPQPEQLASVSYESVAKAVESAQKEPTGRFSRDAIDDETLLSELYALIGGPSKAESPAPEAVKPAPAPQKPAARITPETLQALPEEPEELAEEDSFGNPGWLKGVFILLISLVLSAMTCYAVASDVIGKIF
ncbi:MAG: hypothetical protein IKQ04_00665 [Oscillospiraceae bacterium]|nr:hypothetical protein [Oscillospiraceae bacterium]